MTKNPTKKATTTYAGLDVSLKETAICIVVVCIGIGE